MATREVRLSALLGRHVADVTGEHVGRIEELRAHRGPAGCFVSEFLVGSLGMLERLAGGPLVRSVLRRVPRLYRGYRIPWDQMNLDDPSHPRIRCRRDELQREP